MVQETTKVIKLCLLIQFIILSKCWTILTLWNSCLVSFVEISIWLQFLYFGLFALSMGCIWLYQYFYDLYVSTTPLFDKFHFLDSIIPFERPYWSLQAVSISMKTLFSLPTPLLGIPSEIALWVLSFARSFLPDHPRPPPTSKQQTWNNNRFLSLFCLSPASTTFPPVSSPVQLLWLSCERNTTCHLRCT